MVVMLLAFGCLITALVVRARRSKALTAMAAQVAAEAEAASKWKAKAAEVVTNPLVVAIGSELQQMGCLSISWSDVELEGIFKDGHHLGKLYRGRATAAAMVREPKLNHEKGVLLRRLPDQILSLQSEKQHAERARQLMELDHPFLLPMLGMASDMAHSLAFVTPLMPRSLSGMINSATRNPATAKLVHDVMIHIMADVAVGLEYLHNHSMAHLSLHPRNVLLDANLSVKLVDHCRSPAELGLLVADKRSDSLADKARWHYLAPELVTLFATEKAQPLTQRACNSSDGSETSRPASQWRAAVDALLWHSAVDVWAFGCIFVRLATLEELYPDLAALQGAGELLSRVKQGELSPTRLLEQHADISSSVVSMCRKCTEVQPKKRPSIDKLSMALMRSREGHSLDPQHQPRLGRGLSKQTSFKTSILPSAHSLPQPSAHLVRKQPSLHQSSVALPSAASEPASLRLSVAAALDAQPEASSPAAAAAALSRSSRRKSVLAEMDVELDPQKEAPSSERAPASPLQEALRRMSVRSALDGREVPMLSVDSRGTSGPVAHGLQSDSARRALGLDLAQLQPPGPMDDAFKQDSVRAFLDIAKASSGEDAFNHPSVRNVARDPSGGNDGDGHDTDGHKGSQGCQRRLSVADIVKDDTEAKRQALLLQASTSFHGLITGLNQEDAEAEQSERAAEQSIKIGKSHRGMHGRRSSVRREGPPASDFGEGSISSLNERSLSAHLSENLFSSQKSQQGGLITSRDHQSSEKSVGLGEKSFLSDRSSSSRTTRRRSETSFLGEKSSLSERSSSSRTTRRRSEVSFLGEKSSLSERSSSSRTTRRRSETSFLGEKSSLSEMSSSYRTTRRRSEVSFLGARSLPSERSSGSRTARLSEKSTSLRRKSCFVDGSTAMDTVDSDQLDRNRVRI